MIKTFRHKGLRMWFETGSQRGVAASLAPRILRQLDALEAAVDFRELNLPGYGLHELKGDRKGTWALKVSGNWRITFQFREGDAYNVDLEDYH